MKIKTSELIGPALDWAVAKCEGIVPTICGAPDKRRIWRGLKGPFDPSAHWGDGGPIIEREELYVQPTGDAAKWKAYRWLFEYAGGGFTKEYYGLTPLIAAMRCYVASKLGDEVEIPEELT